MCADVPGIGKGKSRGSTHWLIQILLKTGENFPDLLGLAQVGHGVGDGVMIFEAEQRCQFLLIEFLHANADVMLEDEIEEHLLLGVKLRVDVDAGLGGPDFTSRRWFGAGEGNPAAASGDRESAWNQGQNLDSSRPCRRQTVHSKPGGDGVL